MRCHGPAPVLNWRMTLPEEMGRWGIGFKQVLAFVVSSSPGTSPSRRTILGAVLVAMIVLESSFRDRGLVWYREQRDWH